MVVPADTPVWLEVTGTDVWHTFGISELKVKADAIPGEVDETWFMAEEPGEYTAECFELCGPGHSDMDSDVIVLPQDEFDQWMDDQLTLTITLEDENEEPVTDGFELSIEHQENDEFDEDLGDARTRRLRGRNGRTRGLRAGRCVRRDDHADRRRVRSDRRHDRLHRSNRRNLRT